MTLDQIRRKGLCALHRELGPVGMVRFLQQFETGSGDYTKERHAWLGDPDVRVLAGEIRRQHKKPKSPLRGARRG
ncbi:MAG: hypothetical protein FJ290_04290 [Planctomycetes bacterium]|nr:hypothetical protein [Planctomycetota bacterium]